MLLPTDSQIKSSKQTNEQTRFFALFKKCNIWPRSTLLSIAGLQLTLQFATHPTIFCSIYLVIFLCLALQKFKLSSGPYREVELLQLQIIFRTLVIIL